MNKYVDEDEPDVELHEYDPETQVKQVKSLQRVKAERSGSEVSRTLNALERVARAKQNVMPALVDCCKAYCTVGEMSDVFRQVFGEFTEPNIF